MEERKGYALALEIDVLDRLPGGRTIAQTCRETGLSWTSVDGIMQRAVKRGLARREPEPVRRLAVDEIASRKGHSSMAGGSFARSARRCLSGPVWHGGWRVFGAGAGAGAEHAAQQGDSLSPAPRRRGRECRCRACRNAASAQMRIARAGAPADAGEEAAA